MLTSFDVHLEKLHGIETEFVKVLYYDLPANYSGTYQSYGYSRFCTILEGEKKVEVKGHYFTYDSSASLVLPPRSKVQMNIPSDTKALVFELNDQLIRQVAKKAHIEPDSNYKIEDLLINNHHRNIKEDISHLMNTAGTGKVDEPFLIDLYAQKLIYDLFRHSPAAAAISGNQGIHPMQQAIDYIKQHIHEPVSAGEIAAYLGISESNFSHSFKKSMGISPQKFINQLKIEHSLLHLKRQSVTDAAFDLGYESISHFIGLFKKTFGITPKQYQIQERSG